MRRRLAALALPLVCAGCNETRDAPPPIRPVLTETVRRVTSETFGPFASTVEARYQTQLGFQLAGRMVARDVFIGDSVRKGQRLAALDPTVVQFALLRAKADVANAHGQVANAEGIEGRQRTLAAGGNAPQSALDNAVAGRSTAKAQLDQAEAALRTAEDQKGYTELRANFDGVVTAWTAEVGQYVDNGQAIVTLARPDIREAVVDIPDDLVGEIAVGMTFSARLQAAPDETTRAVVREIGPLADTATRTHRVRLTLQDAPAAFRLGTTLSVSRVRDVAPRLLVPAAAVLKENDMTFVWVLSGDARKVARRAVVVTGAAGNKAVLSSGVDPGEKVVTIGVRSLKDGQAVAGEIDANARTAKAETKGL